jgi:hypothetical protein
MTLNRKHKIFIGAAVVVAAAGGGVAVAASKDTSPGAESKAVIDDAAKQLGIPSAKLSAALKTALADRVDAAVAAGRITKAQGDAMKQRIQSGDFPVLGGFHGGRFGHHDGLFPGLVPAAGYIGVTEAQLRTELESGKTLAQVAQAHGKTADGLIAALVAASKSRLDKAVSAGRITKAQEDQLVSNLKARITELVNRTGPPQGPQGFRGHEGFRHFDDGPSA